ncbi:uncharacterized protein [Nicotiana sylvestris]|uniref:uncharacterized protein n=1 Tax=Nicotiana sylvestris TaxID=4096 RepID=UPI00388CE2C2
MGSCQEKGLGAELQGIVQPVSLPKNLDTFGLGFKPIAAEVRRARKLKKKAWVLPKPIPRLSRSFVRTGVKKQSLAKVLGPLIGAEGNLDKVFERLSLIDEKRLALVCHGQLYQQRMARAYNKKVRPRKFEVGQLVLRRILPHWAEAKGKFAPNWQGPFVVTKVLSNGALYLTDIEGKCVEMAINSDAVKRYYV